MINADRRVGEHLNVRPISKIQISSNSQVRSDGDVTLIQSLNVFDLLVEEIFFNLKNKYFASFIRVTFD